MTVWLVVFGVFVVLDVLDRLIARWRKKNIQWISLESVFDAASKGDITLEEAVAEYHRRRRRGIE